MRSVSNTRKCKNLPALPVFKFANFSAITIRLDSRMWQLYSVPSRVWTVPFLSACKLWKIRIQPPARSNPTARRGRNHFEFFKIFMRTGTELSTLSMGQSIRGRGIPDVDLSGVGWGGSNLCVKVRHNFIALGLNKLTSFVAFRLQRFTGQTGTFGEREPANVTNLHTQLSVIAFFRTTRSQTHLNTISAKNLSD